MARGRGIFSRDGEDHQCNPLVLIKVWVTNGTLIVADLIFCIDLVKI